MVIIEFTHVALVTEIVASNVLYCAHNLGAQRGPVRWRTKQNKTLYTFIMICHCNSDLL